MPSVSKHRTIFDFTGFVSSAQRQFEPFWQDKDALEVHTMASISKQVFLSAIHFNTLRESIFMGKSIYIKNGHTFDFTIYAGLERHSQIRVFIC